MTKSNPPPECPLCSCDLTGRHDLACAMRYCPGCHSGGLSHIHTTNCILVGGFRRPASDNPEE